MNHKYVKLNDDELQNFLQDMNKRYLIIFSEKHEFQTKFITPKQSSQFIYFIKDSQFLNKNNNNLLKNILFGNVDNINFENTFLLILKYIFTCIVYNTRTIPYSILYKIIFTSFIVYNLDAY